MPEATKMDIAQNKALKSVEDRLDALEGGSDSSLEKRVANLEAQVQGLAPLSELLNHITQIKRHFGG